MTYSSLSAYSSNFFPFPDFNDEFQSAPLNAALSALESWYLLPIDQRHAPLGSQLLMISRQLATEAQGFGIWLQSAAALALSFDDAFNLDYFIQEGAQLAPLQVFQRASWDSEAQSFEISATETIQPYQDTMETGVGLHCVKTHKPKCLNYFITQGRVTSEHALAQHLIVEPEPCPLAQIDAAFLEKHLGAPSAATDLILALTRGMSQRTSHEALKTHALEVFSGNPLYALLRSGARQQQFYGSQSAPALVADTLVDQLADSCHLLDSKSPTSVAALFHCILLDSPQAIRLAVQHQLTPELTAEQVHGAFDSDFTTFLLTSLNSEPPSDPHFKLFFQSWANRGEELLRQPIQELTQRDSQNKPHAEIYALNSAVNTLKKLCAQWTSGPVLGFIDRPPSEHFIKALDTLSTALLETNPAGLKEEIQYRKCLATAQDTLILFQQTVTPKKHFKI